MYNNTVNILSLFAESMQSNQDQFSDDAVIPGLDLYVDSLMDIQNWYASKEDKKRRKEQIKAQQAKNRARNIEAAGGVVSNTLKKDILNHESKYEKTKTEQKAHLNNRLAAQAAESARSIKAHAENKAVREEKENQLRIANILQEVGKGKNINSKDAKVLKSGLGYRNVQSVKADEKHLREAGKAITEAHGGYATHRSTTNFKGAYTNSPKVNSEGTPTKRSINRRKIYGSGSHTMPQITQTVNESLNRTGGSGRMKEYVVDNLSYPQKRKFERNRYSAHEERVRRMRGIKRRKEIRNEFKEARDRRLEERKNITAPTPAPTSALIHVPASTPAPIHAPAQTRTSTRNSTPTPTPPAGNKKTYTRLMSKERRNRMFRNYRIAGGATGATIGGGLGYAISNRATRNMAPGRKRNLIKIGSTIGGAAIGGYAGQEAGRRLARRRYLKMLKSN